MPAKAGIHGATWTPAFAGVTKEKIIRGHLLRERNHQGTKMAQ
jgi:hypothetical protein